MTMMIKFGFVSNSSSASFIVPVMMSEIFAHGEENRRLLDKGKEKFLRDRSFRYATSHDTMYVNWHTVTKRPSKAFSMLECSLAYFASCNEGYMEWWLIRNHIPFKCSTDESEMFYDGKSDYVIIGSNIGRAFDMEIYGFKDLDEAYAKVIMDMQRYPVDPLRKVPISRWLDNPHNHIAGFKQCFSDCVLPGDI